MTKSENTGEENTNLEFKVLNLVQRDLLSGGTAQVFDGGTNSIVDERSILIDATNSLWQGTGFPVSVNNSIAQWVSVPQSFPQLPQWNSNAQVAVAVGPQTTTSRLQAQREAAEAGPSRNPLSCDSTSARVEHLRTTQAAPTPTVLPPRNDLNSRGLPVFRVASQYTPASNINTNGSLSAPNPLIGGRYGVGGYGASGTLCPNGGLEAPRLGLGGAGPAPGAAALAVGQPLGSDGQRQQVCDRLRKRIQSYRKRTRDQYDNHQRTQEKSNEAIAQDTSVLKSRHIEGKSKRQPKKSEKKTEPTVAPMAHLHGQQPQAPAAQAQMPPAQPPQQQQPQQKYLKRNLNDLHDGEASFEPPTKMQCTGGPQQQQGNRIPPQGSDPMVAKMVADIQLASVAQAQQMSANVSNAKVSKSNGDSAATASPVPERGATPKSNPGTPASAATPGSSQAGTPQQGRASDFPLISTDLKQEPLMDYDYSLEHCALAIKEDEDKGFTVNPSQDVFDMTAFELNGTEFSDFPFSEDELEVARPAPPQAQVPSVPMPMNEMKLGVHSPSGAQCSPQSAMYEAPKGNLQAQAYIATEQLRNIAKNHNQNNNIYSPGPVVPPAPGAAPGSQHTLGPSGNSFGFPGGNESAAFMHSPGAGPPPPPYLAKQQQQHQAPAAAFSDNLMPNFTMDQKRQLSIQQQLSQKLAYTNKQQPPVPGPLMVPQQQQPQAQPPQLSHQQPSPQQAYQPYGSPNHGSPRFVGSGHFGGPTTPTQPNRPPSHPNNAAAGSLLMPQQMHLGQQPGQQQRGWPVEFSLS
ncbi:Hypothetical predicted protein [Cloeon dipterum]|uniref:Neurogenic mastermind-like N-terminal domain-containing protein n=1 Tax=Cloeon dipterum TaxID=197152 RepID=A0A8S1BX55_9INSE|nr:Hypothetical predicted protein [Cloeon dipterum]